jgi:DNA-3-methyladenine glycosylase II
LAYIRGVGRWTVEMLLMFNLGRMDILPVDDFGVREGYRKLHTLETQPKPKELAVIGEMWSPWRSVASWYLWRAADEGRTIKQPQPAA